MGDFGKFEEDKRKLEAERHKTKKVGKTLIIERKKNTRY